MGKCSMELGLFQDVAWYKSVFSKRLSINCTKGLAWLAVVGCGGVFLFVGLLLFASLGFHFVCLFWFITLWNKDIRSGSPDLLKTKTRHPAPAATVSGTGCVFLSLKVCQLNHRWTSLLFWLGLVSGSLTLSGPIAAFQHWHIVVISVFAFSLFSIQLSWSPQLFRKPRFLSFLMCVFIPSWTWCSLTEQWTEKYFILM